jgi:hypothetical protein
MLLKATPLIRPLSPKDTPLIRPLSPKDTPLIKPLSPKDTPLIRPLSPKDTNKWPYKKGGLFLGGKINSILLSQCI